QARELSGEHVEQRYRMEQGWHVHSALHRTENRDASACAHRSHSAHAALSRRPVPRSLSRGIATCSGTTNTAANAAANAAAATGDSAGLGRHGQGGTHHAGFATSATQRSEGPAKADEYRLRENP